MVSGLTGGLSQWIVWLVVVVFAAAPIVTFKALGDLTGASSVSAPGPSDPPVVGYGTLTGSAECAGTAGSFDQSGRKIGLLVSQPASESHPFLVDPHGYVQYAGTTKSVITNHHWSLSISSITAKTGGQPNAGLQQTTSGQQSVHQLLPVGVTGLFYLHGTIVGSDGTGCTGSLWVKVVGSPTSTIPFYVGSATVLVGAIGVVMAFPKQQFRMKTPQP